MKREALRHPKMLDLACRLGVDRARAIGIVTLLLDFAVDAAPQGDIGKWPDGAIARACEWGTISTDTSHDASAFVAALVDSGWLDRHPDARLLIHDWPHHCERYVKSKLSSLKLDFHPGYFPPKEVKNKSTSAPSPDTSRDASTDTSGDPPRDQTKPNQTIKNPSDSSPQSEAPRTHEPALTEFVFPVVGKGPDTWTLPLADLEEFRRAYPVDIEAEMRKAAVWLRSNPQRRKTARGMMRFLNSWLEKAVNRSSGLAVAGTRPKPESRVPTLEDLENYRPYGPD